jgi:hypothetical protein
LVYSVLAAHIRAMLIPHFPALLSTFRRGFRQGTSTGSLHECSASASINPLRRAAVSCATAGISAATGPFWGSRPRENLHCGALDWSDA